MKETHTVITRKGQTTIPIEIRRALNLKEGDRIAFVVEAERVFIQRAASIVSRTAGMCKSNHPPLSPAELRESAEQAIADEAIERLEG